MNYGDSSCSIIFMGIKTCRGQVGQLWSILRATRCQVTYAVWAFRSGSFPVFVWVSDRVIVSLCRWLQGDCLMFPVAVS